MVGADRARRGLLRIRGAHDLAILRNGTLALENLHEDRTRGHVFHEVLEERALAMHGVEAFSFPLRQVHHPCSYDGQAGLLETAKNLANEIAADAVRLDDGQGAL